MKKVASIFAVTVMTLGLFTSCEADSNVAENDALYEMDTEAGGRDGEIHRITGRQ